MIVGGEPEPDDAADRRQRADREQCEREELEARDVARLACHERDGGERDDVEDRRVAGGLARLPLHHVVAEERAVEHLVVVRHELRAVRARRARSSGAASSTSASRVRAGAPARTRARRSLRLVRPRSATSIAPSTTVPCRFAQSTRIGSTQSTRRPGARLSETSSHSTAAKSSGAKAWARICRPHGREQEADRGHDHDAPVGRSARPGGGQADDEAGRHEEAVHEQHEADPAEPLEAVERGLREPLLVDPVVAVAPDGELIARAAGRARRSRGRSRA